MNEVLKAVTAARGLLTESNGNGIMMQKGGFMIQKKFTKNPHVHVEMYRKMDDGSYGFANPLSENYLTDFSYMQSIDGDKYDIWKKKLPSVKQYWK